ncbi:MAG: MFS transporter [Ignavibacteria bacterium]|nr:MFS transporter [Ignavibacteria bacterium]MBI3765235.1 MFS transporter [Ignavibacteriales bacterium]
MAPPDALPTRSRVFAWTLFDFANTAFSVIIVTVIYSRYFTNHVSGGQRWLWGLAVSLSMIFAAALSPPLGAAADYSQNRKRFLFLFTLLCVTCTALMFFVQTGMVILGMALFILANIGFEGGLVFYDAFLPSLTSKNSYGRVSGYGFGMGYLGALAVLLIVILMLPDSGHPEYLFFVRLSFVVAALFFLIFSLPLFAFVPEPPRSERHTVSYLRAGMKQASITFRALFISKQYPTIARFLIAFFIYNDGILTVIAFAAIFAENILHMSDKDIIVFFAIVQTSAILGSVVFGIITDKIGPKRTIMITLAIWIGIAVGAYFVQTVTVFYIVAMGAGVAIGSSQSASRSMMALLTPKEREAEFFGFYDGLCGKASAVVGPLVYGVIADLTNERFAALSIAAFFIAGLTILRSVPEPERKLISATTHL